MRTSVTLLVLALLTQVLAAQIPQFQFGTNRSEVVNVLNAKSNMNVMTATDLEVTASNGSSVLTYSFTPDGELFKTELVLDFDKRSLAEGRVEEYKRYYELSAGSVLQLEESKAQSRFAAVKERELHEITCVSLGKNSFQVRQMVLNLDDATQQETARLQADQQLVSMLGQ